MRLFVFGLGYTAQHFVRFVGSHFSHVAGTVRSSDKADRLRHDGLSAHALDASGDKLAFDVAAADAILISAGPDENGDPFLHRFEPVIAQAKRARWIGYFSTTGVYGNQDGAWTDEAVTPAPANSRNRRRVAAEQNWLSFGANAGIPAHVFRLSGIYGPGRNPLVNLARGSAHRIIKPGQVFNRVHVDDIAATLLASMAKPNPGAIYNVSDDEPSPPQDVVEFAAAIVGVEPPEAVPFEAAQMSPMAREFYGESKRISNRRIKQELGVELRYPTYREGIRALYDAGEFSQAA
jgi:nucleoside-diphosphate-sugar epimerase